MSPDSLSNFEMLYSTSFTISYLLTWIATVFVLKSYSSRLGNRKFWLLATLPLLFLIGQFQTFLLPLFYQFRLHEPVAFTVAYCDIRHAQGKRSHFLWCRILVSGKKNRTRVSKAILEYVKLWFHSNLCFKSSDTINCLSVSSSRIDGSLFCRTIFFSFIGGNILYGRVGCK